MKRPAGLIGGIALVLAAFVPTGPVTAEDPILSDNSPGGTKSVVASESGSYVVVMTADPLITTIAPEDLSSPEAEAQGAALEQSHDAVLAEAGVSTETKVQDFTNALNGFSAVLDYDDAVKLASNPKVSVVLPDELRHITRDDDDDDDDDRNRRNDDLANFLGLTARGEAYRSGINGEGVVVGVIDTGIWPEHPSFADDGTFPAHDPLDASADAGDPCNFGNTGFNPNDAEFDCNNKLIGARQFMATYEAVIGLEADEFDSARDDNGHGTHTASTAAGNSNVRAKIFGKDFGKISGIAPRSQVIAYKGLGNLGGFGSDLAAAIDQAVADGVDVINYSVGGGTSLLNADTLAYLQAGRAGVWVATSAGNAGPGPGTVGGPADAPWVTAVGANTMRRFFPADVKLDKGPKVTGSSVTRGTSKLPLIDAQFAGKYGIDNAELCLPDTLDPAKVKGKIVLCRRGGNGRVDKSFSVFNAGGKGMLLYNTSDADNLFTDNFWVPTVHLDFTEGSLVKDYIAGNSRPRAQIKPDSPTTIDYAPSMTIFSSRGPNVAAADIIKPDITAPGIQILAGASPFTDPGFVPGELFQAIAGTSMSSPVVAGVFALLKQAHPTWTPAMAKSAIMTTANTAVADNDRVTPAGPFAMGAGMVDPGRVAQPGSAFNPGLVYDAAYRDYLGFMCDAEPGLYSNPDATCAALAGLGHQVTAENLNYPSIGIGAVAGTETVVRTVTSVASGPVTYTATVNAPDGYEVSVDPATITVPAGGKASFNVTVTNISAPLGEFRFGDLTWSGSGYHVRSPIALQGVPIDAPAEVTGTGVAGTASFDVKFGYTGPYAALPHGLVAPAANGGTVFQDPDQDPSTPDTVNGLIEIPYTIAGAAVARWSLIIPGEDDIDLYLFNSAGDLVALSGNGGTNEFIELLLPADDTYTLKVHGWAIASATGLPFSVQSWIVPLAPVAPPEALSVTAPTAAVSGETATITASWSGLTAGTSYLGAVSHNDVDGLIGLTVVSVDA